MSWSVSSVGPPSRNEIYPMAIDKYRNVMFEKMMPFVYFEILQSKIFKTSILFYILLLRFKCIHNKPRWKLSLIFATIRYEL